MNERRIVEELHVIASHQDHGPQVHTLVATCLPEQPDMSTDGARREFREICQRDARNIFEMLRGTVPGATWDALRKMFADYDPYA